MDWGIEQQGEINIRGKKEEEEEEGNGDGEGEELAMKRVQW